MDGVIQRALCQRRCMHEPFQIFGHTWWYKIPHTDLYKISHFLIVRSCPCVIALYYDYIVEINLTKYQKVYEWFYSIVMILCYQIKMDVGETKGKCLSSTKPHISKNVRLFCCSQRLKSIANNRIDANLIIKQYCNTVFRYLHSFLKMLVETLL